MARTVATEPVDHRRATAERNVEAILDAAESLLGDGEATSIAAVAGRAGVSRVTVYAHFASREAILQAVVVRAVQRATAAFDAAAAGAPTATEALERALAESWRTLGRHTSIAQAAAAQLSTDTLRETHESAHGHVRALVERGREDGEFRTDVPVEVARQRLPRAAAQRGRRRPRGPHRRGRGPARAPDHHPRGLPPARSSCPMIACHLATRWGEPACLMS